MHLKNLLLNPSGKDRVNWRLPAYTAVVTLIVSILDAVAESDGIVYLMMAALISILLLIVLIAAASAKKFGTCISLLLVLLVFWMVSTITVKNSYAIRNTASWSLWSRRYKAEVLAQPEPASGELRHAEWDGWGFPGAGDTIVYLVFDPTDSLAKAAYDHQPGKFNGIPCKVPRVSRLESRWYAVLFYTDERWGKAHVDCGMGV
jgi:hypothetical protein